MYDWSPPSAGEQLADIAKLLAAFLLPLATLYVPLILVALNGTQ